MTAGEPMIDDIESALRHLLAVVDELRVSCPWDREQTAQSLIPHLLEEVYEVADAIERRRPDQLHAELGDVLLQIAMQVRIHQETDPTWSIGTIARAAADKMTRRHASVFGDERMDTAADVEAAWEQIKDRENPGRSVWDGIVLSQPGLLLAAKVLDRAAKTVPDPLPMPGDDDSGPSGPEEIGDALLALAASARVQGVNADEALREAVRRYMDRARRQPSRKEGADHG